ncbi:MAG: RluA family pseudouridine synthase [Pseudomonadota bacterium]
MRDPLSDLDGPDDADPSPPPLDLVVPEHLGGERLDKALALLAARADLSRTAVAGLIAAGCLIAADGSVVASVRRKVKPGERYRLLLPAPVDAEPSPEAIPLIVLYEDGDVIVLDKPAGMVVHPAPGAERGTLVNALLHHCGDTLAGIGGTRRPGIVHRLDKDTSGVLVVAKTATAHAGLSAQFAARTVHRRYLALARGVLDPQSSRHRVRAGLSRLKDPERLRLEAPIGRHPSDRKRMAVVADGRHAASQFAVVAAFAPAACLIECRLETGRTHQIRVHAAHLGHALIGDPVYGRGAPPKHPDREAHGALAGFPRQALHAAELGFVHPTTGQALHFSAPLPEDMAELLAILRRSALGLR